METRYFVLKWNASMKRHGWCRYEVRPMSALDQHDERWAVVATDLNFADATRLCKELEAQEPK